MHLPNGPFTTLGGNGAVSPGGNVGSVLNAGGGSASYDATYQDYDGTRAIRILNPCTGSNSDLVSNPQCGWWENANILQMQKSRRYSTAEPLANGTITLIGGFVNGGYTNRNYPNTDPATEGGAAKPTVEFFPSTGPAQQMQFRVDTSGLNSYTHAFTMPSGKMPLPANISAMLWDPDTFQETRLPNGTAGCAERTLTNPTYAQMTYGMSLASGPVDRPSIYNPNASKGSR